MESDRPHAQTLDTRSDPRGRDHQASVRTPSVLCVIVNFRSAPLTIDCLESIAPERTQLAGLRVIVVENGSGDDSPCRISAAIAERGWSPWVEFMVLDRNLGFAGGNNAAIQPALASATPPDYIYLLNPDTVLRPRALELLVTFLERFPKAGLVGSRLENPDGSPQRSVFRFPNVLGELDAGFRLGALTKLLNRWIHVPPVRDDTFECDCVAGASLLVRRQVFESIGLLDDGYFMYYEEVDFCRRARAAGWPCWYHPTSRVVHLVGQSSGVTDLAQPRRRRPRYWFESRRRYYLRHLGRFRTFLADAGFAIGFATFRLRRVLQRKPDQDPESYLSDFIRYNLSPFQSR